MTDGSISIAATFSGSVEFSINGGLTWQSSNTFNNLPDGIYIVMIRNADGSCVMAWNNNPIVLGSPTAPSITNVSSTDPTDCGLNDGTITVTATGGSGNLRYSIDGIDYTNATGSFTGLSAGTYPVSVQNADGTCTVNGSI